jgi:hypothetical protein
MPLPSTMTPIATTIGTGTNATITFSNIPNTYTDLFLVANVKVSTIRQLSVRFNSDTGSNYSRTVLRGDGSTAASSRASNQTAIEVTSAGYGDTQFTNHILQIINYSNTTTNKTLLARSNNASGGTDAIVGLWRNTAAISAIEFYTVSATFDTASTFTLYGVKAA